MSKGRQTRSVTSDKENVNPVQCSQRIIDLKDEKAGRMTFTKTDLVESKGQARRRLITVGTLYAYNAPSNMILIYVNGQSNHVKPSF